MEKILALYRELHDLLGTENLGEALCEKIQGTFREVFDAIPLDARVAVRGGGEHTNTLLEKFPLTHRHVVGIFDKKKVTDTQCGYPCFSAEELPGAGCDTVVVSSFYYRKEILEELKPLGLRVVDPYGELERQEYPLMYPFDQYAPEHSVVLNHYYLRYLERRDGPDGETALREALQSAVELKDFVMLRRLCRENAGVPFVPLVQAKAEELLEAIRRRLRERTQRDILVFWTDAVSYYMLPRLPLMKKRSEDGCFFQRAYTHTPFTHQSLCAMFTRFLPIDDYEKARQPVSRATSPLIQYLEDLGYDVKFIAHLKTSMDAPHLIEVSRSASCNVKWWTGLERLLSSEKPCFYIFHMLEESHEPNISPDLRTFTDTRMKSPQQERQRQISLAYLDQCLALYNDLAGNKIQVFLSDHGQYTFPLSNWSEERLHAYCFVLGKEIPAMRVARFFPYRNFEQLVKWLAEPDRYSLEDACADEVVFQDTDFYNPSRIDLFVRHGIPREGIAVRGVLNYECRYVLNALGEESFFRYREDGTEEPASLEDEELRSELRLKCGSDFLDINRIEQFRHVRKLYEYIRAKGQKS